MLVQCLLVRWAFGLVETYHWRKSARIAADARVAILRSFCTPTARKTWLPMMQKQTLTGSLKRGAEHFGGSISRQTLGHYSLSNLRLSSRKLACLAAIKNPMPTNMQHPPHS